MNYKSISNLVMAAAAASTISSCSQLHIAEVYGDKKDPIHVLSKKEVYADMKPEDVKKMKSSYASGRWDRLSNLAKDISDMYAWKKAEKRALKGINKDDYYDVQFLIQNDIGSEQQLKENVAMCKLYQKRRIHGIERPDFINLDIKPKGRTKQIYNRLHEIGLNENLKPVWTKEQNGWNTRLELLDVSNAVNGEYESSLKIRKRF